MTHAQSHIREKGEKVAHEAADEHEEALLQSLRGVLAKDADHGNDRQVEKDDDGGDEVPADVVLRHGHVEDEPACVADRHESGKVQEEIEDHRAVILVQDDHDEGDESHKQHNHKGVNDCLPDRVPRIVRLLLVYHVHTTP